MADKNNINRNGIDCNDKSSSLACVEGSDYFNDQTPMIGSPGSSSSLSDEFMANLLSDNGMERCMSNQKCDTSCSIENQNSSCNKVKFACSEKESFKNNVDLKSPIVNIEEQKQEKEKEKNIKNLNRQKEALLSSDGRDSFLNEVDPKCPIVNIEEEKEEQKFEDKKALLTSESLTIEAVEKHNEMGKEGYRCGTDSSDDSSSTFSLDSKSDCSDSFLHKMQMNVNTSSNKVASLKTKGELDLEELPLIEDLKISVKETEIERVGFIHAIVNTLVIVRAMRSLQPLDIDSVLFLTPEKPLGRIFDVFGPVSEPFYIVRFNNDEHIKEVGVEKDIDVFYAPKKEEITSYVFVDELQKQKGSDASWKDNNEPPEEHIDYSDDEQEKAAKQKRKAKNRPKPLFDEPQEIKRDNFSSLSRTESHHIPVAAAPSTFNSTHPLMPKPNNSNYLSMAAVMTSSYRPNTSRSQSSFQGPPLFVQPRNPFCASQSSMPLSNRQSSMPLANPQSSMPIATSASSMHLANPPPKMPDRPSGAPFRAPQSFMQHQNMIPGPQQPPSYHPSQSPLQLQSPMGQPVRIPQMFLQHGTDMKPYAFQQSHVFGQVTPLGPMSPVQPPVNFPPTIMSPPPMIPVSIPPPSPNFSYFSHNFASSPSPPAPGQILPSSPWFQGQSATRPNLRYVAPMSPLSIQIPGNLRTPPPTMLTNTYNSVSPMHPQQNGRPPFMLQAATHHY